MSAYRYQALGPLQAGEGSRAFLGLAISADNKARPVVIIWVPEAAEKDPALLDKIRRETEHAAQLDHPNIVTVMGFAKLEQGHARVVEFADGESLRKIIEVSKKLPVRVATRIIIDACTGVHYAHIAGNDDGNPLVHGDLRPETMLISFRGVTKVTGYGALAFAPREIGGQRVKGRRVHSAPEQIIGGRDAISIPTDVYLLGVALFECLTGDVPWIDQAEQFDHAVLTLPLPASEDIPEKFRPLLEKATAKKAADRYPTPLAMREALEAVAGDEIATTEELEKFFDSLFPQSSQLRADRTRIIDAGIADFVRKQWANPQPPPPPEPPKPAPVAAPPKPVDAPKPPPAPPKPPQPPAPAKPAWTPPPEPERPQKSNVVPVAIAIVVALLLAGGLFIATQPPPPPKVPEVTPVPVPVAVIDAGASEPVDAGELDAGEPMDAGEAETDAGATTLADAGATAAVITTVPEAVRVSIDSSPVVELMLDGKALGKTPWSGMVSQGRKVFTLENKALGIKATRAITVKGDAVDENFTFQQGFVAVKAPEGATVFIDGVKKGLAPIRGEIPVYEGNHRIEVRFGQSKWSEPFSIYGSQRVSFNVELQ